MRYFILLGVFLMLNSIHVSAELIIRHENQYIENDRLENFLLPLPGGPFLKQDYLQSFLKKIENKIYSPPQNAYIDETGIIKVEQTGKMLHKQAFLEQLYSRLFTVNHSAIDIKTIPLYPEVDSEILSQIREKKIGQYLTYFNARNKQRSANILLASDAINNQVVFPGRTFSFNQIVGKRTVGKGYMPAPVIVKGELTEGIGGGICQVSSTLFNAADNSGLKIIERYSHSKTVSYVPRGRDATVSWYGPDFRFTNKYNQPILIKSRVYEGKLVVTIYSSEQIHYKPRVIPRASRQLPEEVNVTTKMKPKSSD
jgi:vancomycin resistance protein YoaR